VSYILDALRKSDQLRQRGAPPALLLGQATPASPKQPALLAYGLLAFVLLGAGIAIGWLRPWQPQPAVPAPASSAAKPAAPGQSELPAVRPDLASKPQPDLQAQNSTPVMQAAPVPASAPATTPAPAPARAPAAAQAPKAAGAKRERQNAPPKAAAAASTNAPAQMPDAAQRASGAAGAAPMPPAMALSELPVAIQQELPLMSISVHAYSGKAAERLVGINNRLLREGDEVAPGLRLVQITPDGMVLSYKGYNFRRGVH